MADDLDPLRAAAARSGPGGLTALTALGRALVERWRRAGPGDPAGRPSLDEAVTVHYRLYDALDPGVAREAAAAQLGWLLATRHVAHGGPTEDRERALRLLEEGLGPDHLPPATAQPARLVLAQLLLFRAVGGLTDPTRLMGLAASGPPDAMLGDLDRATRILREISAAPVTIAGMAEAARTMLGLAESVATVMALLGGNSAGLDPNRLVRMMSQVQNLRPGQAMFATGPAPTPFDAVSAEASRSGLDAAREPHSAATNGPPAPAPGAAGGWPPVAAPARGHERARFRDGPPAAAFREPLLALLPGSVPSGVHALLDGTERWGSARRDEMVALAVAAAEAPDAGTTDRVLGAAAIGLRALTDPGGGWDRYAPGHGSGDARIAADRLLAVRDDIGRADATAVTLAFRLAGLLDSLLPGACIRSRLDAGFSPTVTALRVLDVDGMLYPGPGGPLLLGVDGRLESVGDTGPSAVPGRLVVGGETGVREDPLLDRAVVSLVHSGGQVVRLAARTRRPVGEDPVFVANPRGDRPVASMDALVLRRAFHPRSRGFGDTGERSDGAGTADQVLAARSASLLQLGCGITVGGGLELADDDVLAPAGLAAGEPSTAGGLAILPPAPDGAARAALADALLEQAFIGVVGFRVPVPDRVASLVYLVLHQLLFERRAGPADAVVGVRRWLADAERPQPDQLPPWSAGAAADPDLARFADAVVLHGV